MVKRFKTRNELRDVNSGWSLEKRDSELVYAHKNTNALINIKMLKDLQCKTDVECYAEYPQYEYTDDMFIEEKEVSEHVLKKVLTEAEYRIYLKGVIIENILHENFEEARSKLDELLA